jgi:hypothetical protein
MTLQNETPDPIYGNAVSRIQELAKGLWPLVAGAADDYRTDRIYLKQALDDLRKQICILEPLTADKAADLAPQEAISPSVEQYLALHKIVKARALDVATRPQGGEWLMQSFSPDEGSTLMVHLVEDTPHDQPDRAILYLPPAYIAATDTQWAEFIEALTFFPNEEQKLADKMLGGSEV